MKKMHIFEILRVLGVLEVRQPTYLQGSKASKVLKELFSEQQSLIGLFSEKLLMRRGRTL